MKVKEIHPYLNDGNIQGATKHILGSFPVYACTGPDNKEKLLKRNTEGTIPFFYGSCKNRFWGLYHQYIDSSVTVPINKEIALQSLRKNKIAISDIISSCNRKGDSSSDIDLFDKEYNIEMIQQLIRGGVSKVLCTSKGVLGDLEKKILSSIEGLSFDSLLTKEFSCEFLRDLGGELPMSKNVICCVYRLNKRVIYFLAIPSPGSPQRQAHNFGCISKDKLGYSNKYFAKAFKWLKG